MKQNKLHIKVFNMNNNNSVNMNNKVDINYGIYVSAPKFVLVFVAPWCFSRVILHVVSFGFNFGRPALI
jgi:hypothetical protein